MDLLDEAGFMALNRDTLDELLAAGWYRSGQYMFTTDSYPFDEQTHELVWIRYCLQDWKFHPEILAKRNKHFSVYIKTYHISPEIEGLFALYRDHVTFNTSNSVTEYLQGISGGNSFNTVLTEIRDGSKLIAVGYSDLGNKSAAGILNFYHPLYKRYSLGKYLIRLQTDHARQGGAKYFYPGYISPTYPKFDYKIIDAHATEIFDRDSKMWLPYS